MAFLSVTKMQTDDVGCCTGTVFLLLGLHILYLYYLITGFHIGISDINVSKEGSKCFQNKTLRTCTVKFLVVLEIKIE